MAFRSHLSQKTILDLRQIGIATEKDPEVSLLILDLVNIATNIIAILLADQLDEKLRPLLNRTHVGRIRCSFLGFCLLHFAIGCTLHGRIDTGDEPKVRRTNLTETQLPISTQNQVPHGNIEIVFTTSLRRSSQLPQPIQGRGRHHIVGVLGTHADRRRRSQPLTKNHRGRLVSRSRSILLGDISVHTDNRRGCFQRILNRISRNGFTIQWFPSSGFQNSDH